VAPGHPEEAGSGSGVAVSHPRSGSGLLWVARSIDLLRSKFFTGAGLSSLTVRCANLVELDLSNATELRDGAAAMVAEAKNLERLWMGRCKMVTGMGLGVSRWGVGS
jgi:hypothetical protein